MKLPDIFHRHSRRTAEPEPTAPAAPRPSIEKTVPERWRVSNHERTVRQLFGPWSGPDETCAPSLRAPIALVLFTNRSGSNLVAELLATSNVFKNFGESLNAPVIANQTHKHDFDSLAAYIDHLYSVAHAENKAPVIKCSLDQMVMLVRGGVFTEAARQAYILKTERQNKVAQAVSLSIAAQTQKWRNARTSADDNVDYDFSDICQRLHGITMQNAVFDELLEGLGFSYQKVFYETITRDPATTLQTRLADLGWPDVHMQAEAVSVTKQAGAINREFCERFVADYRQRCNVVR